MTLGNKLQLVWITVVGVLTGFAVSLPMSSGVPMPNSTAGSPVHFVNHAGQCGTSMDMYKRTLPDIGYAFLGYNILQGFPWAPASDPGFTYPIFVANYMDDLHTTDCRYSVPRGLVLLPDVSCDVSFSSKLIKSAREYQYELSLSAKASFSGFGFHFSASTDYKHEIQDLSKQKYSYIISTATCNFYTSKLQVGQKPDFDDTFLMWVQRLETSNSDVDYFNFFEKYGTHFSTEVTFGAKFMYQYIVNTTALEYLENTGLDVSVAAGYSGLFDIGFEVNFSEKERSMASTFSENVKKKVITIGAPPPSNADAMTWTSSVQENPVPIYYTLEPIENLFTERYMKHLNVNYQRINDDLKTKYQIYLKNFLLVENAKSVLQDKMSNSVLIPGWYVQGDFEDESLPLTDCLDVCKRLNSACLGVSYCLDCGNTGGSMCSLFRDDVRTSQWQQDSKWNTILTSGKITLNGMQVVSSSDDPVDSYAIETGDETLLSSHYTQAQTECSQRFDTARASQTADAPVAYCLGFVFQEKFAFCKIFGREKALILQKNADYETYIEI